MTIIDARRRRLGAWGTPPEVVAGLLDRALEPVLDRLDGSRPVHVVDPACGDGRLLAGAVERLLRRGLDARAAQQCCTGIDADPDAVAAARAHLPHARIELGDGLTWTPDRPVDVIVANPPFLTPLRRATRHDASGTGLVDVAALFLDRAARIVGHGGRVAMVVPRSVVANRHAREVRRNVLAHAALVDAWALGRNAFPDAEVLTIVLTFEVGAPGGPIRVHDAGGIRTVATVDLGATWSALVAGHDVPLVETEPDAPTVAGLAHALAGFRQHFYGVASAVRERRDPDDEGHPVLTSGRIDPASTLPGARIDRRDWSDPVVDLDALDPTTRAWAVARLVPKVVVATQTPAIEVVADPAGRMVPLTPVVSVVPDDPAELWRLAAALTSPVATAIAARRHLGSGWARTALRLSGADLLSLPLPTDARAWDRSVELWRAAADEPDPVERRELLLRAGAELAPADVTAWWAGRLPPVR